MTRYIVGLLIPIALLAGCGDPDAFGADSAKPFTVKCTEKQSCGSAHASCVSQREDLCSQCYSGCDLETCSACINACDSYTCRCEPEVVKSCSYSFKLPAHRDENLYGACRRALGRWVRCNPTMPVDRLCDISARVDRPELVTSFECYAAGPDPCSGVAPTCPVVPEDPAFADEVCAGVCGSQDRDWISKVAGRFRAEVRDQARACATEPDRAACVKAWVEMLVVR